MGFTGLINQLEPSNHLISNVHIVENGVLGEFDFVFLRTQALVLIHFPRYAEKTF